MATIKVQIKGLKQLRNAVKAFPNIARPPFRKAMDKSLLDIEGAAKPSTPIDTGRLRGSYMRPRS